LSQTYETEAIDAQSHKNASKIKYQAGVAMNR